MQQRQRLKPKKSKQTQGNRLLPYSGSSKRILHPLKAKGAAGAAPLLSPEGDILHDHH